MRKPLEVMEGRVAALAKGEQDAEALKFMIYSAHDDQIDNMMVFLTGTYDSFDFVHYASTVIFELTVSESCMVANPDDAESCFHVSTKHDGVALEFEGCTGPNTTCTWPQF